MPNTKIPCMHGQDLAEAIYNWPTLVVVHMGNPLIKVEKYKINAKNSKLNMVTLNSTI